MRIDQTVTVRRFTPGQMTIRVKIARRLRFRIWLALQTAKLTGWLLGAGVEVERGEIDATDTGESDA